MTTEIILPQWAPRVPKEKLRRLYEQDAQGILDPELIDEVGWLLYERCRSILQADDARRGRVRCPRCDTIILRSDRREETELLHCDGCGWELLWHAYAKTFRRKQLNTGGAGNVFRGYVEHYPQAQNSRARMLLIDKLIHEFHRMLVVWSNDPQPSRPVCPNLIEGKLS